MPVVKSTDAVTREAATYAVARLDASRRSGGDAGPPRPQTGPTVGSIPYDDLLDRLSGVTGDVALGRKLFVQQSCSVCHTTAANEPEKGPFLGGIYTRYSKAEVLESILRPAAKVAQGFATHVVHDGRQTAAVRIRDPRRTGRCGDSRPGGRRNHVAEERRSRVAASARAP